MLTNFRTVKQSVSRLKELEAGRDRRQLREAGQARSARPAPRARQAREASLGGIKDMNRLPDALFVIDIGHEDIAVKEAKKLGIPVIAVVDTNYDPALVDYAIPGNDDAIRAVQLYARAAADAVLEGKAAAPQFAAGDEGRLRRARRRRQPGAKKRRPRPRRPARRAEQGRRPSARRRRRGPPRRRPAQARRPNKRQPMPITRPRQHARLRAGRILRIRRGSRLKSIARHAAWIRIAHDDSRIASAHARHRGHMEITAHWSRNCASVPAPA